MTVDLAVRVEALEARVAFQERTIDDLDRTVTAQWTQIDALVHEMGRLNDRLQQTEDGGAAPPASEVPPHY